MNDNKEVKIHLSIKPTWSILKEVHEKTESFLKNKNFKTDFIEATVMCGAELVENAIKYGSEDEGHSIITFDLTTHEGEVVITATNGIMDEEDAVNVKTQKD